MNILVTGCNGFIGAAVAKHLKEEDHNVYNTNTKTLDVSNELELAHFFWSNEIDIVIHAAASGGRRNKKDTAKDMYDNIIMFENLAKHTNRYKLLISFGSGAEFDRRFDIAELKEEDSKYCVPTDYYGLSKKIISQRMKNYNNMIAAMQELIPDIKDKTAEDTMKWLQGRSRHFLIGLKKFKEKFNKK